MNIFPHNFNPASNSGPNKFTRQLFDELSKNKKVVFTNQENADVEFCLIQEVIPKLKPRLTRLDGIYFNVAQNYKQQNYLIEKTYNSSDAVVFQSIFNRKLTEHWFGIHSNSYVIRNAASTEKITNRKSAFGKEIDKTYGKETEVWCCASSWRPHKRLIDNIEYFLHFSPPSAKFIIAGDISKEVLINNEAYLNKLPKNRVAYVGNLSMNDLYDLYARSTTLVHLAYLDHCPNVVVDAVASNCQIVFSSTGGTKEIVKTGIVIPETEWDFSPIDLYNPPALDFTLKKKYFNESMSKMLTLKETSQKYYNILQEIS